MDRDMPKPDRRRTQPPLADTATAERRASKPVLADGCYLIYYSLAGSDGDYVLEGTLRLETKAGQRFASGDLYRRQNNPYRVLQPIGSMSLPERVTGIPSFPIKNYRFYLRATAIEEVENGFNLVFEAHRFSTLSLETLEGLNTNWALEGIFTAQMAQSRRCRTAARAGSCSSWARSATIAMPSAICRSPGCHRCCARRRSDRHRAQVRPAARQ